VLPLLIAPRWRKVLRDVLGSRTRTLLVIASIAVGVVAVGMVTSTYMAVATDLPEQYAVTDPLHIRVSTALFDDPDVVDAVRRMPAVEEAEGARRVLVNARVAGPDGVESWQELQLYAIDDFDDQHVNVLLPEAGQWPPGEREVLIERASLAMLNAAVGGDLTVKLGDDRLRTLRVAGLAHDLNQIAANLTGITNGYITFDTLEWLGYGREHNQIEVRVAQHQDDRAAIEQVAAEVEDRIEEAGVAVGRTFVPTPGTHEMEQFFTPMLLILGAMGILSLLLSSFLVVNIITALLAQQTRQIGIMKTVGATARQVSGMYLVTVLVFGALALLLAVPLGIAASSALTGFAARLLNFDVVSSKLTLPVLALEIAVALAVPVVAAVGPVLRGTRRTVREAVSDYGIDATTNRRSLLDRTLERVRGLSRPQLISLRNTFRRKGRLLLTLTTLTLASATFIAVFSVRSSLYRTMDEAFTYWNYEVNLNFSRDYRADPLADVARSLPGVTAAEAWGFRNVTRNRPDGTQSDNIALVAPPPSTTMIHPTLLDGRWLLPGDENALVINTDLLADEPDLRVGDTLVLDVDGRDTEWQIVGLIRSVLSGPSAYANFPYFTRATHNLDKANSINVALADKSPAAQAVAAEALEAHFTEAGLHVTGVQTTTYRQERLASQFGVLTTVLAIMALLLAVVGGLGLMGTMSINILERRREIGVMRSIGASTPAIMRIVVIEGMIIGAISWALGALLAIPLSKIMSDAVGTSFMHSELTFRYSLGGAAFWLAAVLAIAAGASFVPARAAARLTVREVLAYE
jgi:putative ABC transport system permease protein